MGNRRVFVCKAILWSFTGLACAVAAIRFARGLGVATALSDTTPWGLWVGFDVMGGVALAAGGFVVAAVVHIFGREKYRAAARPAILTAFLGYAAVVVGLLFDLGLPWHVWHPVVFWNIRSALFEVAWCVMLYLTVLALEVAPLFLERTRFQRIRALLMRLALPLMILGIMLSTLHQSSLGSLLLIMPFRIHPLWYSSRLPELFFVSAIGLGLAMVMLESVTTSWLYRRRVESEMLEGLARMATWVLAAYLAFRMADLAAQEKLGWVLAGTWESRLFLAEMALSAVLPILLYVIPGVRRSGAGIWLTSGCAVLGFVLNRISASGLAQVWATDTFYFPAWTEFAVSIGILCACGLAFLFIQEHFPVDLPGLARIEQEREQQARGRPEFAPFTQVWLGTGWRKAARVYSMLFILAASAGLTAVPAGEPVLDRPAQRGRGGEVLRLGPGPRYVYFPHDSHQERAGKERSCPLCHHLHKPGDIGTPCSECHRTMYAPTSVFQHGAHVTALRGSASCAKCHGAPAGLTHTTTCDECHRKDMMATGALVPRFAASRAPGYRDAMHGLCIPCHSRRADDPALGRPDLGRCGTCHNEGTRPGRDHAAGLQARAAGSERARR